MIKSLPEEKKVTLISIYLFIFVVSIYMISISWPNVNFVDQYHQRYEMTKSIVQKFELSIPEGYGIKGIDGKDYPMYGLGWSALAVPFYIVGDYVVRNPENFVMVMNPVMGGATVTLVFLFSIALCYPKRASLVVAIFYGLGTFAWPLAKQPFIHVVETFFVLLSVYCVYIYSLRDKISHLVLSAIAIGLAMNTNLTSSLVLPALLIMIATDCSANRLQKTRVKQYCKNMGIFFIILLPFVGIILWYNYYRFGSLFETGFQLYVAKTGLDYFSGTPLLTGLRGFLTSPGKGFFYYSPIAIFFFLTIISFYKMHPGPAITFIIIIISYLIFHSHLVYWHGDWAWGPRYLLAITPFTIIPITELLVSDPWVKRSSLFVIPVCVVLALSIMIQIASVSVNYYNHFYRLQIDQNVQFPLVGGSGGLPGIAEPPPEVYFDWTKSPIVSQMKDIKRIGNEIINYKYVELPQNATNLEKIKAHPSMHLFDFWWVYMYYISNNWTGFVVLLVLLIVVGVCGHRMMKISRGSI